MATVAPAHGADNVVPNNEDSGGPPLPHRGHPMWASKKKAAGTAAAATASAAITTAAAAAALRPVNMFLYKFPLLCPYTGSFS